MSVYHWEVKKIRGHKKWIIMTNVGHEVGDYLFDNPMSPRAIVSAHNEAVDLLIKQRTEQAKRLIPLK